MIVSERSVGLQAGVKKAFVQELNSYFYIIIDFDCICYRNKNLQLFIVDRYTTRPLTIDPKQ